MALRRRQLIGQVGVALGVPGPALASPARKPEIQLAIAETSRGRVRGSIYEGIRTFKGIPYGAPTDGENRFLEAKPAIPWKGVLDAHSYGPACPQEGHTLPPFAASWAVDAPMSEDCLFLNIWTPGLRDHHKRPVMVWLHGGGFSTGSGGSPVYDGINLARKGDVVVVTVNHRLNVFGHLYLSRLGGTEYAESGNVGILDLVAALRWLHVNIAEFGGDPANVTIFGQGGGGAKVSLLMAMPQTRGLIHRVIVQSCSQLDGLSPDDANANTLTFLKAADVPVNDLSRLRKLAFGQLLAALRKTSEAQGSPSLFGPVMDGRFLPKTPWVPDGSSGSAGIPMMIGTTKTETTGLIGANDPSVFTLDEAGLRKKLASWLPANEVNRVVAGFRKSRPEATPADLFFAITTARQFRQVAWLQAEHKAAQNEAPVWLYELDWQTPVDGGKWQSPDLLDLPFVFDNVSKSASVVGEGNDQRALADHISGAWIAFAHTGNPNGRLPAQWLAFRPPDRSTMILDVKPRVVNDYRGDERQLLASLPPYRAGG